MEFSTLDVVAASCSAFRKNNGFYKKYDSEVVYGDRTSNSAMLYSHFFEDTKLDISKADSRQAGEIIDYLKGLGFKALERKLTDFETNVLKFVTAEQVGKELIGIAASLPKVYKNKVESDTWADREIQLGRTSEYVGTLSERCEFDIVVEYIKYIPRTDSHLITGSVDNKNIIKFFITNSAQVKAFELGKTIRLAGYVKSQDISSYSNFKETMINRIKVL